MTPHTSTPWLDKVAYLLSGHQCLEYQYRNQATLGTSYSVLVSEVALHIIFMGGGGGGGHFRAPNLCPLIRKRVLHGTPCMSKFRGGRETNPRSLHKIVAAKSVQAGL